jgi:hypothetical protein
MHFVCCGVNAATVLSGLSRIEKALNSCVSVLQNGPILTEIDVPPPPSTYILKPPNARERGSRSQRSFARRKGLTQVC